MVHHKRRLQQRRFDKVNEEFVENLRQRRRRRRRHKDVVLPTQVEKKVSDVVAGRIGELVLKLDRVREFFSGRRLETAEKVDASERRHGEVDVGRRRVVAMFVVR